MLIKSVRKLKQMNSYNIAISLQKNYVKEYDRK